ncbi:MAG: 5-oxoprolinase subunit PxpA [Flavobacteriaceae bacterium]|nr:5-oxoprolinase subunit PxpA [Candidatus Arcticimaribacter sp.]
MHTVDLNCDMGEGAGNDALLMPFISSCSIACGGHVGDEESIKATLLLAKQQGVQAGAHPAYPDPEHFGRKTMQLSNEELKESLLQQLRLFLKCCELTKSPVHHIKPHGALYNDLFHDAAKVEVFVAVIKTLLPQTKLYCSPGSLLEKEALRSGIQVKREGFMDRTYNEDRTLRSRLLAGAVLTDLDEVGSQVLSIVKDQAVPVFGGGYIPLSVQTLCLHGDHPQAVELIQTVNRLLKLNGIDVH